MYWDQSKFTYVPVNSGSVAIETTTVSSTGSTEQIATASVDTNSIIAEEKPNKPAKAVPKTAAQIAKVILYKRRKSLKDI